jgi:hypothetical protein
MKIILLKIDYLFDKYLGWFFTNGMKEGKSKKRLEHKKNRIEKLKNNG